MINSYLLDIHGYP